MTLWRRKEWFCLRMFLVIGILAMALSGCGKSYWYSTSKNAAAFQQDRYQCETEAANYSANMGQPGKKSLVEQRMIDCMKLRGYGWADTNDVPQGAAKFE